MTEMQELQPAQKKSFGIAKTFELKDIPDNLTVEGYAEPSPFVPKRDDNYIFRKDLLSDVLAWHMFGSKVEGLYLTGPTGSGKTSIIDQVASRLQIPVMSVNAHSRMETPELVGHYALVNGNMSFVDGPLTIAMRKGWWFVVNEIDLLDPSTAAGLNSVAEGRPLVIPEKEGEIVTAAEGFGFIVTANSAGNGDSTGLYQGVLRQNLAFVDRFWMSVVDYPDTEQEMAIIKKAVDTIPEEIAKTMIAYAQQVRKLFVDQQIEVTMSTRTLIRWARLTDFFRPLKNKGVNPIHHALDRALCFRAEPESQSSLHEIAQRMFGG